MRYRLGAQLGSGGMAEVYAGVMLGAEGFERRVAVKRVRAELAEAPAIAAMFVAEARIAARLAHPNVVSVLDFARDPEGRLFLVMEYVDGKDLASLLASGPIAPSLAIFIVVEMLRALDYAHELRDPRGPASAGHGVIHRDVSPQNLLLSYEGAVKVADFGLAKLRAAGVDAYSETVRGKPSYMSPEQMAGEPLDGRSDLYAVGVMLWEMLAHRPLFAGTAKEIMAQAMFKDVPTPSSVRRDVPADLEAIAMRMLARDRDRRFASAEAALAAVLACRDAPRDGRGQLARTLAARFPDAMGARPRGDAAIDEPARPPDLGQRAAGAPHSTIVGPVAAVIGRGSRRLRSGVAIAVIVATGLAAAALAHGARPTTALGPGPACAVENRP